jgi:uracil-DNA glycosylase
LKTPSTARPARAWQIIWPAFVNVIRTGMPCRYLPLVRWMQLLVVGLGPGEKGARPDARSGMTWRRVALSGIASLRLRQQAAAAGADGWANPAMLLDNCRITNAVRCLPPANKPTTAEIRQCNNYLAAEVAAMPQLKVIVALGPSPTSLAVVLRLESQGLHVWPQCSSCAA